MLRQKALKAEAHEATFILTAKLIREGYSRQDASKMTAAARRMLYKTLSTSSTRSLEHTIKLLDIPLPTHCIYLGIKLRYERIGDGTTRPDTASVDRIDSSKGYIPGNIQVISLLANRMKQNATPEQLLTFAKSVIKISKKSSGVQT